MNRRAAPGLSLVFSLIALASSRISAQSVLKSGYAGRSLGPHAVGFRTLRDSAAQAARPALSIWYPAAGSVAKRMTVRDYLATQIRADSLAPFTQAFLLGIARSNADARGTRKSGEEPTLPDSLERLVLTTVTAARANAAPARGKFPLVVIAQTGSSGAADVNHLGEEIASHGFVVAIAPNPFIERPRTAEKQTLAYVAHIANIVTRGRRLAEVDTSAIGLFDPGGLASLLFQSGSPLARAIVATDEGAFPAAFRDSIVAAAPRLSPAILRLPLGEFSAANDELFDRQLVNARRQTIRIPGATHGLLNQYVAWFNRRVHGAAPVYEDATAAIVQFFRDELAAPNTRR